MIEVLLTIPVIAGVIFGARELIKLFLRVWKRSVNVFSRMNALADAIPYLESLPKLDHFLRTHGSSHNSLDQKVDGLIRQLEKHTVDEEAYIKDLIRQISAYRNEGALSNIALAKAALIASDTPHYIVDLDVQRGTWSFSWANESWYKMWGVSEDGAKAGEYVYMIDEDDKDRVLHTAHQAVRGAYDGDALRIEYSLTDGRRVLTQALPLVGAGKAVHIGTTTELDGT